MSEFTRNLKIEVTEEELTNAIHNEEVAGFLLRGMSITTDGQHNQLMVEEGEPPVELAKIKVLAAAATDAAAAEAEARKLHDDLPIDGGVVAWGKMGMKGGLRWVAAYRNKGMATEAPSEGTDKTNLIGNIVALAISEWQWWKALGKPEQSDDGSERVRKYWLEGPGVANRTGKDREHPWSAAFISYVMEKGGAGTLFKQSESHQVYIYEAIQARKAARKDYGYWAYELTEKGPEVGDLICAWRKAEGHPGPVTLTSAANGDWYPSHCDLVVEKTANSITTIGGNVGSVTSDGQTGEVVGKKTFPLVNGKLTAANFDRGFAILVCQMGGQAVPAAASPTAAPKPAEEAVNFKSCSDGWETTGYYTPVEGDYAGDSAEAVQILGFGEESFAKTFLKDVRMEGWGKTRFGWYLGYYSSAYHKADSAKDALGRPLKIGTVAVDRQEIPFGRQLTLPDLPDDWGKTIYKASDVGGMINNKHIDVYCGEGKEALKMTKKVTINKPTDKLPNKARVCFS